MAPEQASAGVVDQRADIYAFGLIFYEMLAGRRASSASGINRLEAMRERFEQGLPALRTVNPEIPEPVGALVARAIDTDLNRRYQTTAELAAELSRLDEQGEIIPEPRRVTPRLIAAAAALFIANPLLGAAVGAGTLLAQKMLNNPFDQLFSYEYSVTGSFDDPVVARTNARASAAAQSGAAIR
jgi:serine/threonine protein kinase